MKPKSNIKNAQILKFRLLRNKGGGQYYSSIYDLEQSSISLPPILISAPDEVGFQNSDRRGEEN
jgi:hypothetical protein